MPDNMINLLFFMISKAMKVSLSREAIDIEMNEKKVDAFRMEMMECVRLVGVHQ
jgi:hypothetical protein